MDITSGSSSRALASAISNPPLEFPLPGLGVWIALSNVVQGAVVRVHVVAVVVIVVLGNLICLVLRVYRRFLLVAVVFFEVFRIDTNLEILYRIAYFACAFVCSAF